MLKNNSRPMPLNRTIEQLRNHYEVEKELATRLKNANREERRGIYATMYDELFERVPDHSRLQIRDTPHRTAQVNKKKWILLEPFLDPSKSFVEFAPGSCRFAIEVCQKASFVFGVDISDQSGQLESVPDNFQLIIYDGYELDLESESVDIVYSDQLLEHFHPEDTELHLELAHRILKPGGCYIFQTPHRFTGPHDISVWFTEGEAEGFHLKEWTYSEFDTVLKRVGFRSLQAYRISKGKMIPIPMWFMKMAEKIIGGMWHPQRVSIARRVLKTIVLVVQK